MHLSATILIVTGMVCYVICATTTAIFFGAIGILVEFAAWFVWFAIVEPNNNNEVHFVPELKSQTEDLWLLRHPVWVRWTGWIGLPLVFMAGIYCLMLPVWANNFELLLLFSSLLLGGFPIYMCIQGFKVFPYIKADVKFNESGFSIHQFSTVFKEYKWSQVGKLKHYASASVLEILNHEGERILAITEQATNYNKFVELAVESTSLKY